jgi:hypothetical protein
MPKAMVQASKLLSAKPSCSALPSTKLTRSSRCFLIARSRPTSSMLALMSQTMA